MIFSVNSLPSAGYYTFLIQSSDSQVKKYRVAAQAYTVMEPVGKGPWNITAYNGETSDEISEQWTVKTPDALLTTANEIPAFS